MNTWQFTFLISALLSANTTSSSQSPCPSHVWLPAVEGRVTGQKHQTLCNRKKKCKQNKEKSTAKIPTQNQTPWTPTLWQSFLHLNVSSSALLLSLLLSTCSKQTEEEASLTPLCAVCSSVTIQLLPFYAWFRGSLGIKRNCTRHKLVPAVIQNLWLLSSSSLPLLADTLFWIWERTHLCSSDTTHFVHTWSLTAEFSKTQF